MNSSRANLRRLSLSCLLATGLLWMTACNVISSAPKPGRYDIRFELDPKLVRSSIQIDVVGPNAVDLPKWESYSINDYWKPGNAMRKDAIKVVVSFGSGNETLRVLPSGDPMWTTWLERGATAIVIIADLPGEFVDKSGNADPRRLSLPLDRRVWGKATREIRVKVQESGMTLETPRSL